MVRFAVFNQKLVFYRLSLQHEASIQRLHILKHTHRQDILTQAPQGFPFLEHREPDLLSPIYRGQEHPTLEPR
jgi:hypothetical protein